MDEERARRLRGLREDLRDLGGVLYDFAEVGAGFAGASFVVGCYVAITTVIVAGSTAAVITAPLRRRVRAVVREITPGIFVAASRRA